MKSFGPLKISGKYKIKTNYCFAATVQVQVNTRCKRAPEIESILGDFNITFFRFPKILSLKLFDLGFFEFSLLIGYICVWKGEQRFMLPTIIGCFVGREEGYELLTSRVV